MNGRERLIAATGGWCAPTACGAGVCTTAVEHDSNCPEPGWAYRAVREAAPALTTNADPGFLDAWLDVFDPG